MYSKAHADGDSIVHFRDSNVIHMGDTFFNGFCPFIDGTSGGTPDGVIAAADRVLALADDNTRIIPGRFVEMLVIAQTPASAAAPAAK